MSRTRELKKGFYVSPNGESIIELIQSRDWKHGFDIIILDTCGYVDNVADIPKEDARILFGSWTWLG